MKQTWDDTVTRAALVSNSPRDSAIVEQAARLLEASSKNTGEPPVLRFVRTTLKLYCGIVCLITFCFMSTAIADDRLPKRDPLLLRIEDDRPRVARLRL